MLHKVLLRTLLLMWGAFLYLGMAPARAAVAVPPGTEVPLEITETVSTKTAKKGDVVHLRVVRDVMVDGKTVIPAGAPALGVVESVKKPGPFGKRGELKIGLTSVKDVDGDPVPLDPYKTGNRFTPEGPAAATAGLLVLGPLGLVGGAFVKGRHVTIEEGTRIVARVKG